MIVSESHAERQKCACVSSQRDRLPCCLQVGNLTYDEMYWTRPENINGPRPFYYVAVKDGNSDLLGQLIGAFASAAPLFQTLSPAYYTQLLTMAQALYGVMIGVQLSETVSPTPYTQ